MKKIIIEDSGSDKYRIRTSTNILGRMYDNNAEIMQVTLPQSEIDNKSICSILVSDGNSIIYRDIIKDKQEFYITNQISTHREVKIGFCFIGGAKGDEYIKNTEVLKFVFLEAQKPDDFVPETAPEVEYMQKLYKYGFTDAKIEGNKLCFKNLKGDTAFELDIASLVGDTVDSFATNANFSMNNNDYKITLELLNNSGNSLCSKVIDLPLEEMVVNATYNNTSKNIELILKNGNTTSFPVGDLISGLVTDNTEQTISGKKIFTGANVYTLGVPTDNADYRVMVANNNDDGNQAQLRKVSKLTFNPSKNALKVNSKFVDIEYEEDLSEKTVDLLELVKGLVNTTDHTKSKMHARWICRWDSASQNISNKPTGSTNRAFVCDAYAERMFSSTDYRYRLIAYISDYNYYYIAEINQNSTFIPWRRNNEFYSENANVLSLRRTVSDGGAFIDYFNKNQTANKWRVGMASNNNLANIQDGFSMQYGDDIAKSITVTTDRKLNKDNKYTYTLPDKNGTIALIGDTAQQSNELSGWWAGQNNSNSSKGWYKFLTIKTNGESYADAFMTLNIVSGYHQSDTTMSNGAGILNIHTRWDTNVTPSFCSIVWLSRHNMADCPVVGVKNTTDGSVDFYIYAIGREWMTYDFNVIAFHGRAGATNRVSYERVETRSVSAVDMVYDYISTTAKSLEAYPVGAIYISVDATSPANLFGGSWTAISAGKVLWTESWTSSTTANLANSTIAAGLPNIKGTLKDVMVDKDRGLKNTGALEFVSGQRTRGWSSVDVDEARGINFNANKYNAIYSDDITTVQPPAQKVYAWRRVS